MSAPIDRDGYHVPTITPVPTMAARVLAAEGTCRDALLNIIGTIERCMEADTMAFDLMDITPRLAVSLAVQHARLAITELGTDASPPLRVVRSEEVAP